MISVTLTGFNEGIRVFRKAQRNYDKVLSKALLDFGEETVDKLKKDAYAGAFGPAKRTPNGSPPLIDTEVYIKSYKAKPSGNLKVDIEAEGDNTFLSNADLAELLEYGSSLVPAHPHLRILAVWIERNLSRRVGDRMFRGLFGRN